MPDTEAGLAGYMHYWYSTVAQSQEQRYQDTVNPVPFLDLPYDRHPPCNSVPGGTAYGNPCIGRMHAEHEAQVGDGVPWVCSYCQRVVYDLELLPE